MGKIAKRRFWDLAVEGGQVVSILGRFEDDNYSLRTIVLPRLGEIVVACLLAAIVVACGVGAGLLCGIGVIARSSASLSVPLIDVDGFCLRAPLRLRSDKLCAGARCLVVGLGLRLLYQGKCAGAWWHVVEKRYAIGVAACAIWRYVIRSRYVAPCASCPASAWASTVSRSSGASSRRRRAGFAACLARRCRWTPAAHRYARDSTIDDQSINRSAWKWTIDYRSLNRCA